MATVSVLYIEDDIVSPHLELIRNVCEPNSRSRPHITVRFFKKLSVPDEYSTIRVSHIDLLDPGSFGLDSGNQQNYTVYLNCKSEELQHLEHKPSFPTSKFHITLYDGPSKNFAFHLLRCLRRYSWGIRVRLPKNGNLTQLPLKSRHKSKNPPDSQNTREFRNLPSALFFDLFKEKLSFEKVKNLTNKRRLEITEIICENLMRKTLSFEKPNFQKKASHTKKVVASKFAMHLTPPELALEITQFALKYLSGTQRQNIDFGDPSVGTGAFYAALLRANTDIKINSAIGVDIDPAHLEAARWRWGESQMELLKHDYLHLEDLKPRNLILANPPYLRHQSIPKEYKLELRQRASSELGYTISGLSGQYVYFVLLSHRWMNNDAVAAWLIPSEFMKTKYGLALRCYLTEKVTLLALHQFAPNDIKFENAKTLPCLIVFRKKDPKKDHKVRISLGGSIQKPEILNHIEISALKAQKKWSIQTEKVEAKGKDFVKLGELFSVKRGIATGANDFFVIDLEKANNEGIPKKFLKPVLPKVRYLRSDIVERSSDGLPVTEKELFLIDTNMPYDAIAKQFPKFKSYLDKGEKEGLLERNLIKNRRPWYKQEQRDRCQFLCTYMGRNTNKRSAIRFIWNKSSAVVLNTYLILQPNPNLQKLLDANPSLESRVFQLLKNVEARAISIQSRELAEGLQKIEPGDLKEVIIGPIPDFLQDIIERELF